MFEPVRIQLRCNGQWLKEFVARQPSDLNCRIEMKTGVGWQDVSDQYRELVEGYRTVAPWWRRHRYEKWDDGQQEVIEIEALMQQMTTTETEIEDIRAEWYREWHLYYSAYAGRIPRPPLIYWIGMALSAIWLVAYLVIYPSIPFPFAQTHWKGMGVPGGCQPWTAICEMQQGEAVLQEVRSKYFARVREMSASELAADAEMREFISRAGHVRFEDQCAGCHGHNGAGISADPVIAPALNDATWLHGRSATGIQTSIMSEKVHPFGLNRRMDEPTARLMAVYVNMLWPAEATVN